jgi:DNA mismatch repair protein MutS
MKTSVTEDYFSYFLKYKNEYGEKTCLLYQIGKFYEIQMIKNEKEMIGNLTEIAELLNIQVTKKNKNITQVDKTNPLFAGFPIHSLTKFLQVLLENGYTVVVVDQNESMEKAKTTRKVSGIYSPSIYPTSMDLRGSRDDNNLTSIWIETNFYSLCNIDMVTNKFDVYEKGFQEVSIDSILEDIYRLLIRYQSKEIIVNISEEDKDKYSEKIIEYLEIMDKTIHWRKIDNKVDLNYQNTFFRTIYKHIDFGLLDPIEFFDLEKYPTSILNCIQIINFIAKHDIKYIQNIAIPVIVNEYDYLTLEMNTLAQLNVFSGNNVRHGSLLNVINKTCTAIGRRGLKRLLCKPLKLASSINARYELSICMKDENLKYIQQILCDVCDFERLHRRLSLQNLHPCEFYSLDTAYKNVLKLMKYISTEINVPNEFSIDEETITKFEVFIKDYSSKFNIEEMRKYNLNDTSQTFGNFFNRGMIPELDSIEEKISAIESELEKIRSSYESMINKCPKRVEDAFIKMVYVEQEGYMMTCTKIRMQLLQKELSKEQNAGLTIKTNTSVCRFSSQEIRKLSNNLINHKEMFAKKLKLHYLLVIEEYAKKYRNLFENIRYLVEVIDIAQSNQKCKQLYNYCVPEVENSDESFVEAYSLRHPIIERINQNTEYVPNDVKLVPSEKGMVLYALNSCGKSSLLRSLGLSVLMAQCGLFVPCQSFKFAPFHSIISQVDLHDNMWKSQSSFVSEMIGLKRILKMANKNCLVLVDELTKGTEVVSATSIFAAVVLHLISKNAKFIFTTHLQDVAKLEEILNEKSLQICHLSVDIKDNIITFERKLQKGPSSELYGLEVARAVGLDKSLIDLSFDIRNKLVKKKKEITNTKRSRYNKSKILDVCEICGYTPTSSTDIPLDTHHIKFQCTADDNNFTGHFHKNAKFNLVCLCKQCHIDTHNKKITINGYKQTLQGTILDYFIV